MMNNYSKNEQKMSQLANQNGSNYSQYSSQKSHIKKLQQQNQIWSPISKKSNSQNRSVSINNRSKDFYVNVLHCPSENSFSLQYQKSEVISQKLADNDKQKKQLNLKENLNLQAKNQPSLAQSNVNIIVNENQSPKTPQTQKKINKKENQSQPSIQRQKNFIQKKLNQLEELRMSYKITKLNQDKKIHKFQKQLSQLSNLEERQNDNTSFQKKYSHQEKQIKFNENDSKKQKQSRNSEKSLTEFENKSDDLQLKIKEMVLKLKEQYKQLKDKCHKEEQISFKKQKKYSQNQKKYEQKVESSILNYLQKQKFKTTYQEKELQNLRNLNKKLSSELSAIKHDIQNKKTEIQSQSSLKQQSKKSQLQQQYSKNAQRQKQASSKELSILKSQVKQKQFQLSQKNVQIQELKEKLLILQNQRKKNIKLQEITKQFQSIKTSNVNLYEYTFDLQQQIARLKDSREQSYVKMRKAIEKQYQEKLNEKIQEIQSKNIQFSINSKNKTTNQILLNELMHSNQIMQKQLKEFVTKNDLLQKEKVNFQNQRKICNEEIQKLNNQVFINKKILKEKQAFIQQLQSKIFTLEQQVLYLNQTNQSHSRKSLQINQNSTQKRYNKIYIQQDNSIIQAINNNNKLYLDKNFKDNNASYQLQQLQQKLIQRQEELKFRQNYLKQKQKQLTEKQKELILKEESIYQIQLKVQSQCRKMNMRKHQLQNQYQEVLSKYHQIKKKQNTIILEKCNQYLNFNNNSEYGLKAGLNNYFKTKTNQDNSIQHVFAANKQILIQEQPINTNRYISQLSTSRSQRSRSNSLEADKIISKMRANGNLTSNTCNCHRNGMSCRCSINSRQKSCNKVSVQIKSPIKLVTQQRRSPVRQNRQTIRSAYYTVKEGIGSSNNQNTDLRKRQDKNIKLKIIEDKVKRIKNEAGILGK